jgi:hypothetical protein
MVSNAAVILEDVKVKPSGFIMLNDKTPRLEFF